MTPAERRRRIEAGQRAARERMLSTQAEQWTLIERLLEQFGERIRLDLIEAAGTDDGGVNPWSLPALEAAIQRHADVLQATWQELLGTSIASAAGIGAAIWSADSADVQRISRGVLDFLREFRGADGLQLSDRLWRLNDGMRADVMAELRNGIVRGHAADRQARELLRAGTAVPEGIAADRTLNRAQRLVAAVQRKVRQGGDVHHQFERLFTTETNRAYTEAFVTSVSEAPGVAGVRFTLSPLHPRPDICDLYARANLHGLGKGVYPAGAHPYPAHPMTLSFLVAVFVEDITPEDRAGTVTPFDWLRTQPDAVQTGVLGGQRKQQAFVAGQLLPGDLRAPWRDIRTRLGQ